MERVEVPRERVLAYRVAAQGLDRAPADAAPVAPAPTSPSPDPADPTATDALTGPTSGVLGLGVQDTPRGSARLALAARGVDSEGLVPVWSYRGAPYLHPAAELPSLASALWPLDGPDAVARMVNPPSPEAAAMGVEAYRRTAEAFREVVTGPMPKGEASAAVTARVPSSLVVWCERCGARHVAQPLFLQSSLPGGVRLDGEVPATLVPVGAPFPVPEAARGTAGLAERYLRLLGPARPAEVAAYWGTRPGVVREVWPEGLVEVTVRGRRRWLPGDRLDALRGAEPPGPDRVRLLPPGDPLLQARDRDLVLPDATARKALWRPVGGPGALLSGAEVAGVWRVRAVGRAGGGAVEVTVSPFARLSAAARRGVEAEAERVARVRGAGEARVRWEDPSGP
ncbi:crosslink repair DNA glycosylase YcaQ family protein [Streptomyces sp. NPDC005438]|uniref:DNA glycosylase AlkZ-like family protein n=1 Tax=Streptomyces sp. NPDC005438 TaxID=3156880 RepID=UPI0033A8B27F